MDFPGRDSLLVGQVCAVLGTRALVTILLVLLFRIPFGRPGLRMRFNNLSSLYPRFVTDLYSLVPSVGLTGHYTVYSASLRLQPPIY